MGKVKMTISIDEEVAEYLRATDGVSSTIEEAVGKYRARLLEQELEGAYSEGAEEAEQLEAEWRVADTEVED